MIIIKNHLTGQNKFFSTFGRQQTLEYYAHQ